MKTAPLIESEATVKEEKKGTNKGLEEEEKTLRSQICQDRQ